MNTSEIYLSNFLISKGITLTEKQIKEFELQGNESKQDIEEYAYDYLDQVHTNMCEAKLFNYYN
jgi:hypothetical protein